MGIMGGLELKEIGAFLEKTGRLQTEMARELKEMKEILLKATGLLETLVVALTQEVDDE